MPYIIQRGDLNILPTSKTGHPERDTSGPIEVARWGGQTDFSSALVSS
jgi:hypothetical protein